MKRIPFELIFWIVALISLAMAAPQVSGSDPHFTICPLANLGIDWCPGCGLGRAITHLFHGNIRESLDSHRFAIPAVIIIGYRVATLSRRQILRTNLKNKENYDV